MREKQDRFQQRKINAFFAVHPPSEGLAADLTGADVDMEARPDSLSSQGTCLCGASPPLRQAICRLLAYD